jgi:outer membrane protein OmpA-like peptidoglycan-associated protein
MKHAKEIHMSHRAIVMAITLAASAASLAAQQRGTVEFGAYASAGTFDKSLTLNSGFGVGGRVGVYLDPRWAIEFEEGEMNASRTLGLKNANVGMLSGRIVNTLFQSGNFSLLLGAGAGASTETSFTHSYGVNALLGAKFAVSDNVAIRVDGVADFLANYNWKSNQSLHVGLSLYRSPKVIMRTIEVQAPAAATVAYVQHADSVSADEQARRRQWERDYLLLRDSLNRTPRVVAPMASSAAALATMEEKIHFATDKSVLTPEAKATLDAKVAVFRANPGMRIIIVGNTDERASDRYNMGLGGRRAVAAKEYLVSQGIDAVRIEITSEGERMPVAAGKSPNAEAQNRRDEFRLLISTDYLVAPKP